MATERQLQFRVGLFVIVATTVCVALVIRFGDVTGMLKKRYPLIVHFENAGGLYPSAPVTLSGLSVGSIQQVRLDREHGGVNVKIEINDDIRLPTDSRVIVTRSLMGESSLELIRGVENTDLSAGDSLSGVPAADPLVMIQRLEAKTIDTLAAFASTGQEWRMVAQNINSLMDTQRGHLDMVIERAADSLHEFANTMRTANQMIEAANDIVVDPASQKAMKETLVALPRLVNSANSTIEETHKTVIATRQVLDGMNRNLVSLSQVTEPVGKRGEQMVAKLDNSLTNIDTLLTELNRFVRTVNHKEGSFQKFIADPSLYNNLDRTSQSMAVLMRNLEPMMRDLREFSDKVARNPELLGVGGAVRPSPGLKDEEILHSKRRQQVPTPAQAPIARGKSPN